MSYHKDDERAIKAIASIEEQVNTLKPYLAHLERRNEELRGELNEIYRLLSDMAGKTLLSGEAITFLKSLKSWEIR